MEVSNIKYESNEEYLSKWLAISFNRNQKNDYYQQLTSFLRIQRVSK